MLKALDKHLRSLCRNPAESQVPECFVTDRTCCVQGFLILMLLSCLRGLSQHGHARGSAEPSQAGTEQQRAVPTPASPAPGHPWE